MNKFSAHSMFPAPINRSGSLSRLIAFSAIGTGFVWASIGQGSGELIFWPYLVAKYGLALVGWILPACLLQYWVNLEIGRYTILTGETIFSGFDRSSKITTWILGLMILPSFLWFGGYASAGGTALATLTNFPAGLSPRGQSLFWAYATIAAFALFVLARVLYRALEKFMLAVSFISLIGVIIAVFHPSVVNVAKEYFLSYFQPRPGLPPYWDPKDSELLITAVTFAGMGGFYNLFYSYWLRDKGVGMAGVTDINGSRLIGRITSPLTGKDEAIPAVGFVPADNPENRRRYKLWMRGFYVDNAVAVGMNLATVTLLALLSYAILAPKGIFPSGWNIAVVQSQFFEISWGAFGKVLFLMIACLFLADTWPGLVDGVSRMLTDFMLTHGIIGKRPKASITGRQESNYDNARFKRVYWVTATGLAIITCVTLPLATPGTLLILQGVSNFFAMVIYCPLLIYLSFVKAPQMMPSWVRPGIIPLMGISAAALVYSGMFVWYLTVIF